MNDPLPLSLLNDHLYCPRRAGLKVIDGLRGENEFTVEGSLAHAHVDLPGFEQRAGWTLLRGLPIYSDHLGLSGKADLDMSEHRLRHGRGQIAERAQLASARRARSGFTR
ncbi:MAG: hypothetical protein HY360_21980 [Verrucomicrobia bacterium]|nr:hypothetical protein [Verrucomicrobiota bacterium]